MNLIGDIMDEGWGEAQVHANITKALGKKFLLTKVNL